MASTSTNRHSVNDDNTKKIESKGSIAKDSLAYLIFGKGLSQNEKNYIIQRSFRKYRWFGYLAIILILIPIFAISDPIKNIINYSSRNDIVYSFQNEKTSDYQLETVQEGIVGVYYLPTQQWCIPPSYIISNFDGDSLSIDSYNNEGLNILAQRNDYALIEQANVTKLYFKGIFSTEIPKSGDRHYASIIRCHKKLYYIYANGNSLIYDLNGNEILSVYDKNIEILSDNVIKVGWYDCEYYDISGKPITSLNLVVLHDKSEFLVDLIFFTIISIICCVFAHYRFKRFLTKRFPCKS